MAADIQLAHGVTGRTLYFVVRHPDTGDVWNGTAFESYNASNWTAYDVPMTEQTGSGYYVGDFPDAILTSGDYPVEIRWRVGGTPAITDPVVGAGTFNPGGGSDSGGGSGGSGSSFYSELRPAYTSEVSYPVTVTLSGSGTIAGMTFSAAMVTEGGVAATGTPTAVVSDAAAREVLLSLPGQSTGGLYMWSVRRTDDSSNDVVAHGVIEIDSPTK